MGAMGAALGGMVANLSAHKPGWDERWHEFAEWAEKAKRYQDELVRLIDEDTNAFNRIMAALSLPKGTEAEKAARKEAIQAATLYAIEIPARVVRLCCESMEVMRAMAEHGNPNSVSDAGVGAMAARSGAMGAFLNVKINAAGLDDKSKVAQFIQEGEALVAKAQQQETEILAIVERVIAKG